MHSEVKRPADAGEKPDFDPVSRLVGRFQAEGFTALSDDEGGERIWSRPERVLFARGETVFHLIDFPQVDEKTVEQAIETIANLYRARGPGQKALSVFQTRTVYVCIIALGESPHHESLGRYAMIAGGAILVPVVIVPEINQVVYPVVTGERRAGTIRPRIEYLQYLLGERREPVDMHRQTIRTFWFSAAVVGILLIGIIASVIFQ
ncbi:MAG TPA: hypothetical protein VMS56_10320 [Thermoanaerobaculia bacterium]|nr:hypothetical protein [Thermoanaerobaculia bacterium]